MKFKFIDLINDIENLPNELLTYDSVLYRINDSFNGKNYIGTAKNGMPARLYDRSYGHVLNYRRRNEYKCQKMYINMSDRINDFSLIIEEVKSPKEYNTILSMETEMIKSYDSVLNGYNVSVDGKPGWKPGTVCVTNEEYDLYIYPYDIDGFVSHGFRVGSCKHSNLKGMIFVTNGIEDRIINPEDLDEFSSMNYHKGKTFSPNKGKVWKNNGIKSKLLNIVDLNLPEFSDFIYDGRIEPKRKPRGKYSAPPKRSVHKGEKIKQIPEDELEDFLKENPDYEIGRPKFKIVSNDILGITTHIPESRLDEFINHKGYRLGRLKHKER